MLKPPLRYTLCIAFLFLFVSSIALLINHYIFQYPGNNYFPPHTLYICFALCLMYWGSQLCIGTTHRLTISLKETLIFFMVMAVLIVATNAAQYTPFKPIDNKILALQDSIPITTEQLLIWVQSHPHIKHGMEWIYDSLTYQMTYIPLFVIFTGHFHRIRTYYFLLLTTGLMGYSFYYFFPTTAPASMIESIYFSSMQRATGLKFTQIHHYIHPTTMEGGMIAFPSFHVIWAYLCVFLVRDWPILFYSLLVMNLILVAACVVLGWHYLLDLVGSLGVIGLGHFLYRLCSQRVVNVVQYRSQPTSS